MASYSSDTSEPRLDHRIEVWASPPKKQKIAEDAAPDALHAIQNHAAPSTIAVATSSAAETVTRPQKAARPRIYIPAKLTQDELPFTLHTKVSSEVWQECLQHDDAALCRFMIYDAAEQTILITHLPGWGHNSAVGAFADAFAQVSSTYGLPITQKFRNKTTVTTRVGSSDGMWVPYSLPPPNGVNIISCVRNQPLPYGTLWLEVRDSQPAVSGAKLFNAKLKTIFGPEPANNPPPAGYVRDTSVQLVVELQVKRFGPNQYFAAVRLWDWNGTWPFCIARGRPRRLDSEPLQATIEFGQVDRQGNAYAAAANPCVGPGTHLLHLPINLLYANVPAAHVPVNLPNPPCLPGMFTIDLFDVQRMLD